MMRICSTNATAGGRGGGIGVMSEYNEINDDVLEPWMINHNIFYIIRQLPQVDVNKVHQELEEPVTKIIYYRY